MGQFVKPSRLKSAKLLRNVKQNVIGSFMDANVMYLLGSEIQTEMRIFTLVRVQFDDDILQRRVQRGGGGEHTWHYPPSIYWQMPASRFFSVLRNKKDFSVL